MRLTSLKFRQGNSSQLAGGFYTTRPEVQCRFALPQVSGAPNCVMFPSCGAHATVQGRASRRATFAPTDGSAGAARLSSPESSPSYRCPTTFPRSAHVEASLPASHFLIFKPNDARLMAVSTTNTIDPN